MFSAAPERQSLGSKLRWLVVQETQLVAAGFPCVDVSRAGLRRGMEGKVRCCLCAPLGEGTPDVEPLNKRGAAGA